MEKCIQWINAQDAVTVLVSIGNTPFQDFALLSPQLQFQIFQWKDFLHMVFFKTKCRIGYKPQ